MLFSELRRVGDDAGARAVARGEHVAVPHRPARRPRRTSRWRREAEVIGVSRETTRSRRSRWRRAVGAPRAAAERRRCSCSSAREPRPPGCRRSDPRPVGLRLHRPRRDGPAARARRRRPGRWSAIRTCWRPAFPASFPSATCVTAPSSASRRRWARAAWRSRSSTSTWPSWRRRPSGPRRSGADRQERDRGIDDPEIGT